MNSILKFLKEWWPLCLVVSLLAAFAGYMINGVIEAKERRRQEAKEVARLEAGYKYKITHHHARRYSYDDVYYANSYETYGQNVEFVDCTGRRRVLTGDVTITENK